MINMSEYQILSADSTGLPTVARLVRLNPGGRIVNTKADNTIAPIPILNLGMRFVNSRNNNQTINKTLLAAIQFSKTTKVLNNPVTFVSTLTDARPTQGRVFPIVR